MQIEIAHRTFHLMAIVTLQNIHCQYVHDLDLESGPRSNVSLPIERAYNASCLIVSVGSYRDGPVHTLVWLSRPEVIETARYTHWCGCLGRKWSRRPGARAGVVVSAGCGRDGPVHALVWCCRLEVVETTRCTHWCGSLGRKWSRRLGARNGVVVSVGNDRDDQVYALVWLSRPEVVETTRCTHWCGSLGRKWSRRPGARTGVVVSAGSGRVHPPAMQRQQLSCRFSISM